MLSWDDHGTKVTQLLYNKCIKFMFFSFDTFMLGQPSNLFFGNSWEFGPTRGEGLTESQVFIEIYQSLKKGLKRAKTP